MGAPLPGGALRRLLPADKASEPAGPEAAARDRGARWLAALLGVLLAACALGLAWQLEKGGRLAGEVQDLQGQVRVLEDALAGARARVDAQRQHLDVVRDRVHALRGSFDALESLVDSDPAPAPAPVEPDF